MARPLTLLLVGHGQSEWNARGLMQGQTDGVPLTELGHAQAAAGAAELAALRPGALLSSDARLHGRVARFLEQLRAEPPADVVGLVTHGDTIRAVQAVAAGLGPSDLPAVTPPNGSVTRVELAR